MAPNRQAELVVSIDTVLTGLQKGSKQAVDLLGKVADGARAVADRLAAAGRAAEAAGKLLGTGLLASGAAVAGVYGAGTLAARAQAEDITKLKALKGYLSDTMSGVQEWTQFLARSNLEPDDWQGFAGTVSERVAEAMQGEQGTLDMFKTLGPLLKSGWKNLSDSEKTGFAAFLAERNLSIDKLNFTAAHFSGTQKKYWNSIKSAGVDGKAQRDAVIAALGIVETGLHGDPRVTKILEDLGGGDSYHLSAALQSLGDYEKLRRQARQQGQIYDSRDVRDLLAYKDAAEDLDGALSGLNKTVSVAWARALTGGTKDAARFVSSIRGPVGETLEWLLGEASGLADDLYWALFARDKGDAKPRSEWGQDLLPVLRGIRDGAVVASSAMHDLYATIANPAGQEGAITYPWIRDTVRALQAGGEDIAQALADPLTGPPSQQPHFDWVYLVAREIKSAASDLSNVLSGLGDGSYTSRTWTFLDGIYRRVDNIVTRVGNLLNMLGAVEGFGKEWTGNDFGIIDNMTGVAQLWGTLDYLSSDKPKEDYAATDAAARRTFGRGLGDLGSAAIDTANELTGLNTIMAGLDWATQNHGLPGQKPVPAVTPPQAAPQDRPQHQPAPAKPPEAPARRRQRRSDPVKWLRPDPDAMSRRLAAMGDIDSSRALDTLGLFTGMDEARERLAKVREANEKRAEDAAAAAEKRRTDAEAARQQALTEESDRLEELRHRANEASAALHEASEAMLQLSRRPRLPGLDPDADRAAQEEADRRHAAYIAAVQANDAANAAYYAAKGEARPPASAGPGQPYNPASTEGATLLQQIAAELVPYKIQADTAAESLRQAQAQLAAAQRQPGGEDAAARWQARVEQAELAEREMRGRLYAAMTERGIQVPDELQAEVSDTAPLRDSLDALVAALSDGDQSFARAGEQLAAAAAQSQLVATTLGNALPDLRRARTATVAATTAASAAPPRINTARDPDLVVLLKTETGKTLAVTPVDGTTAAGTRDYFGAAASAASYPNRQTTPLRTR